MTMLITFQQAFVWAFTPSFVTKTHRINLSLRDIDAGIYVSFSEYAAGILERASAKLLLVCS